MKKICIVCPVRNLIEIEKIKIDGYVKKLEEEGAVISYYDPYIPEFTSTGKEYKSLKELTAEDIREKDIVIITTAHTAVDYKMVAKNAKAVFDTRNAIKDNSENVESL